MFKDRIKELRADNDLSLMQFAKMTGISKTSVSLYEAGKQNPSRKTIEKICEVFDVTEEWLFEEEAVSAEETEEFETEAEAVSEAEEPVDASAEETEEAETEPDAEAEAVSETEEPADASAEETEEAETEPEAEAEDVSETEEPVDAAAEETEEPPKKPAVSNTKGESKMSKKSINKPIPPIPFTPFGKTRAGEQNDEKKAKANEMKDNYKELLKKYRQENVDARKTSVQNRKDKQAQAFDRFMEMQETFAGFLSENPLVLPFAPMYSIFPKKVMKQFMEIERLTNEYFKKQADVYADFCAQRKNMFQEMVATAVTKNAEPDAEEEAEAEEKD